MVGPGGGGEGWALLELTGALLSDVCGIRSWRVNVDHGCIYSSTSKLKIKMKCPIHFKFEYWKNPAVPKTRTAECGVHPASGAFSYGAYALYREKPCNKR